ncbi:MAG: LamG-like jellyroll fold domain-containing protein, partial [Planctomycetota bacterium]
MCKKLILLASFVLMLSAANNAVAEQLVYWPLDEGFGRVVNDSTGNGYNGTFEGGPQWVEGIYGGAVQFDGMDDYVIHTLPTARNYDNFTVALWAKAGILGQGQWMSPFSSHTPNSSGIQIDVDGSNPGNYRTNPPGGQIWLFGPVTLDWVHLALVAEGTTVQYYYNGTWAATGTFGANDLLFNEFVIGTARNLQNCFNGAVDDFHFYDHALTEAEVQEIMTPRPPGLASAPRPADEVTDVPREVVLSWTPGEFAGQHDVYFGTTFDDVNNATNIDLMGADKVYRARQEATSYAVGERLDFGQTYYWRVDEVNAPPTSHVVFKGDIWQFTAEPFAYAVENITVTASSFNKIEEGPENTINGSGLDDNDLHSDDSKAMWLSSMIGPQPSWIEFQFDNVYKLHQMLVWNHNSSVELVVGFGIKEAIIEYSVDGVNWTTLGTTHEFARAPGADGYASNTTIDLSGVVAKYVKITANSNWGGIVPQYGLSEVRFLYIPVVAREPSPDSGVTDVDVDVTLSFRAGREAAQHNVYLGTDEQAVIDGNVPAATITEDSYGPLSLGLGKSYYWRVDEVNEAETPTTWQGTVWNFATREFLVVDDFEFYNDLDPGEPESNRIFLTWIDGFEQPTNGSVVGYPAAPFTEQDIVHSGGQSMPLFYDNTGTARYSEAELMLTPAQDWTKSGITALSLWFSGDPNNVPDQMFVKINGLKVAYDGDAGNLTLRPWQPWNIDLAPLGMDLQNVTKFSVGFGDETSMMPGGSGVVYVDDIRLYPYSRQLATPAEPAPGNLVAHYELEGTVNDSSGNGLHGTAMGAPAFVAGKVG